MKLYKVLVDGKSCHGGSLSWCLPEGDQPGAWHEVHGEIITCSRGLHLTDNPIYWWKEKATAYLVEADGVVGDIADHKVAARRVRLLQALTDDELNSFQIFTRGVHSVKSGAAVATGSSQVTAYGSSQVTAYGSSQVKAYGSSQVTAYGSSQVTAYGSSQVTAYGSSQVTADGSSQVTAYGSSQVKATGSSQVTAYDRSQVTAEGSSQVTAEGSSQVMAYDRSQVKATGSSQVTACDRSQVKAEGSTTIVSWWGSPTVVVRERAVHIARADHDAKPTIEAAT